MKLPCFLLEMPIRRKVTLLLLVPCGLAMLLVVAILFAFQLRMFEVGYASELAAAAHIVSANSKAAVASNDTSAMSEILNSLQGSRHITSAILIRPDGTICAAYGNHVGPPVFEAEERYFREGSNAFMIHPLTLEGQQIGMLNLRSDFPSARAGLIQLSIRMLTVLLAAILGIAALLSLWLQHLVSKPIQRLAQTARSIADNSDFSVRAYDEPCGELGILTRAFNQMLIRIQSQETALLASKAKLEAILNSIGGVVWEANATDRKVNFVSRPFESMFGYRVEQWLQDRDFWLNLICSADRNRVLETYGEAVGRGKPFLLEYRVRASDGRLVWVREDVSVVVEDTQTSRMRGLIVDVTEQRNAADHLERLNRRLNEVSRLAGMAEVATDVLHNVGNVLNSLSVSVSLLSDRLKAPRLTNLRRATTLLTDHSDDLASFLTQDHQGKVLPEYLARLSEVLETEQWEMVGEVELLSRNVEHIKQIVSRQQSYATVSGVFEEINPTELVEDALRINETDFERHRVMVIRDYASNLPRVVADRHKVLHILVNLARNAKQALDAGRPDGKVLTIRLETTPESTVAIRMRDNGTGIAPDHLTRIFQHGFTTKKDGHGFGLHSGANAAKEMGGRLYARSEGPGCGAEFTLELPIASTVHHAADKMPSNAADDEWMPAVRAQDS